MPARRPAAVVFDVNETLFGLEPLCRRLQVLGLPEAALEWWFAVVLREGFALAAAGYHRPFADVAAAALAEVEELAPHPDAERALRALADAGIPASCLTNGSAEVVGRLLDRARLSSLVRSVVSVDDAGHWKPRPEPYRHAAAVAGVALERLALVAVHPWDVHGAIRAGLAGAWVNRSGGRYSDIFAPPAVAGSSLAEVVEGLLALPER